MARQLTAAERAMNAARNKQGAALLAAQKNGTYKPPTPTPAAQAKPNPNSPKPAPALPKTAAPVSQVSSYTPPAGTSPLGNQKVGGNNNKSGGNKSGGGRSNAGRGGNAAASLAGLNSVLGAVNNALSNKGKSPISTTPPGGVGRAGKIGQNLDAAKQQANRLEGAYATGKEAYDKVRANPVVKNATNRLTDLYRDVSMPGTGAGVSAALNIGSNLINKYAGTDLDLGATRNQATDYFNKEIATNYGPAARFAQGDADNWDKAALGIGVLPFGAGVVKGAKGAVKGAGLVEDAVKALVDNGKAISSTGAKSLASKAFKSGLTVQDVKKMISQLYDAKIISDTNGNAAIKHFDALVNGGQDAAKQAPTAPKAAPPAATSAQVEAGVKPTPRDITDRIRKIQADNFDALAAKAPVAQAPANSPELQRMLSMSATASDARVGAPAVQAGAKIVDNAGRAATGTEQATAQQLPSPEVTPTYGQFSDAMRGATDFRMGQGRAAGNARIADAIKDVKPVVDKAVPRNMFDFRSNLYGMGQGIESGIKALGTGKGGAIALGTLGVGTVAGTTAYSAMNAPAEDPAAAATTEYSEGDSILGITDGTVIPDASMDAGVQPVASPVTGGGGYSGTTRYAPGGGTSSGGGYAYSNAGGGKNAVETTYYQLDETGNPVTQHVGYIIDGHTYQDPNGQTPIPQNSLVETRKADGSLTYYLNNEAYSNGMGGYNPYSSTGPNGMPAGFTPQTPEVPEEPVTEQENIMQQVIDAMTPQLESQYAQIDSATQQRIQALKEEYAARGLLNSDAIATEIDRIMEEGEAQKDALYGQVLAQAYQTAMQYDYQNRTLEQDQSQFEQTQQFNQQKLEQDAAQFAAQLGLNYQELSLQEKKMLLDEAYRQEELNLGYYKANRTGGSGSGVDTYGNMTELNAVVMDALSNPNMTPTQAAQYIKMTAQTLPGVTQDQITQAWNNYKAMRGTTQK